MPQTKFVLECKKCGSQNYTTSKNRQNVQDRITLKKHCPRCNKHTEHSETRLRR